jgi:hypothetical protein
MNKLQGLQRGKGNLLAAKAIHLIVLAPTGYYTYKTPRGQKKDYDLCWLEDCLNDGLCQYLQGRRGSLPSMDFRFQCLSTEFEKVYRPLQSAMNDFRKTGIALRNRRCS